MASAAGGDVWVPPSVREDPERVEEFRAAREGVPTGMRRSLAQWCVPFYTYSQNRHLWLMRNRLLSFERITGRQLPDQAYDAWESWRALLVSSPSVLLDTAAVALMEWADDDDRETLTEILRSSRSAYRIGEDEHGRFVFQHRYSDELTEIVEDAASQSGRPAEHLRIAWSKLAGHDPDPGAACWEVAKAVEAAGASVVIPSDGKPTLGKMLKAMEAKPDKWTTSLTPDPSIRRVIGMMQMVWEEAKRHADSKTPIHVDQDAAEMVVQTAVVLTHWFVSGFIQRR